MDFFDKVRHRFGAVGWNQVKIDPFVNRFRVPRKGQLVSHILEDTIPNHEKHIPEQSAKSTIRNQTENHHHHRAARPSVSIAVSTS